MECGVSGRYFEVWIFFIVKSVQICKSNEGYRSKHHMGVIDPNKWYSNSKILPLWNNDCDYSSGMRLKITQSEQKKGKNKYILTTKATKDNNNNTILIKLAGRQAGDEREKSLCAPFAFTTIRQWWQLEEVIRSHTVNDDTAGADISCQHPQPQLNYTSPTLML